MYSLFVGGEHDRYFLRSIPYILICGLFTVNVILNLDYSTAVINKVYKNFFDTNIIKP